MSFLSCRNIIEEKAIDTAIRRLPQLTSEELLLLGHKIATRITSAEQRIAFRQALLTLETGMRSGGAVL